MYKRILSILVVSGLLLLSASTAFAQVPPEYVYSVKFVCGVNKVDPDKAIVEPGIYATEINIHNYRSQALDVKKEFLILVDPKQGAVGREPNSVRNSGVDAIRLSPNTATMDDCQRIREITQVDTSVLTIGYVVLRSSQEISVDAVYTTTGFDAGQFPPPH